MQNIAKIILSSKWGVNVEIIERMLSGDELSLSRLITLVENGDVKTKKAILQKLFPYTGNAHIIGFTGSPGVGKSTLVDRVAQELINRGKKVGILAVIPVVLLLKELF